jgi:hypothetical protein
MGETLATIGRTTVAVAVLLAAAWLLLKVVIGVVATVAWIGVVIVAIVAVVWALRVL